MSRAVWILASLLLVAAIAAPLMLDDYYVHLLIMAGIFFIPSAGMNLLLASGQLTLGHTAFFGIGAYTSGLLALHSGLSPLFGMVIAAGFSGVLGWLLGTITLRLRGAYFVLVTIGFAEVIRLVDTNWIDLTQGPLGLPGIPGFDFGTRALPLVDKRGYYYVMLVLAGLTLAVTARLLGSRFGRALVAIRQNESLAESVGISAYRYTLVAMTVACALAGAAGSFYGHYTMFLSPELFAFYNTVTMVVMVVAGGQGTVAGPAVGAIVFTFVPELLRMASFYRMLVYGGVLLLCVMFMPRGIVHSVSRLRPARGAPLPADGAVSAEPVPGALASGRASAPMRADFGIAEVDRAVGPADGPVLQVSGITVRFGGLTALQDVTFTLDHGEILALIGPNGAGKTTAFNVITGFLVPSAGRVLEPHDLDLTGLPPDEICRRGLTRMFQKTSVFPDSTVLENVTTGCHRLGRDSLWTLFVRFRWTRAEERRLRERAGALIAFVGVGAREHELARNLSYGEQRLLGLAIALGSAPRVLLLDEPAAGLNAVETARVMRLIDEIRRQGISVLLVEHDMKMVMGISDRIVVLNHGQTIAEGTPIEIQHHPEVIRAYLGSGYIHARP